MPRCNTICCLCRRRCCRRCCCRLLPTAFCPAPLLLIPSFKEAEKVLELEMKEAVPEQNLLIQSWLGGRRGSGAPGESDGVVEGLLFATAADGDPEELVAAFDRLAAWVDNSLEIYKVRQADGVFCWA